MMERETRDLEILCMSDLLKIFNCCREVFNSKMDSRGEKIPAVKIGVDYYSTNILIEEYFKHIDGRRLDFKVVHKRELMSMFKMRRTKFNSFIKVGTVPIKRIGADFGISQAELERWFEDFAGKKVLLDY